LYLIDAAISSSSISLVNCMPAIVITPVIDA
jgi:hypothetical protein